MAAFNFPNSPSTNDTHSENNVTWKWDGTMWNRISDVGTTLTHLNVTGISTLGGNVQIGGVLTYEDVKNVDSVGIITAREGIKIPDDKYIKIGGSDDLQIYHAAGAATHINATGLLNIDGTTGVRLEYNNATRVDCTNSGVSLVGDVDIADKIVHTGDTNTAIRFPSADTVSVETSGSQRLKIDSDGRIGIGGNGIGSGLGVYLQRSSPATTNFYEASDGTKKMIAGVDSTNDYVKIGSLSNHRVGIVANNGEKLSIASGGQIGIGITNPEAYEGNGNNLVVGDTTNHNGITILTGTDKDGRLGFADGTGAASYRGMIEYQHGTGDAEFMKLHVAGNEVLRITSDRKVGINRTSPARHLHAYATGAGFVAKFEGSYSYSAVEFADTGTTNAPYIGSKNDDFTLSTGGNNERLRIDSSGRMGLGTNAPDGYDNEAENFVVASSNHTGITIASTGSDKRTNLYFADGTSGNAAYRGAITYDHNGDFFQIRTSGSERLRITSQGRVNIGEANLTQTATSLSVTRNAGGTVAGESVIAATCGDNTTMVSALLTVRNAGNRGNRGNGAGSKLASFEFNDKNAMTITKSGSIGIGTDSPDGSSLGSNTGLVHLKDIDGGNTALKVQHGSVHGYFAADSDDITVAVRSNHFMQFQTNSSERLRIHADGEVEIKAAANGQTVLSCAAAYASGSTVNIQTWERSDGAVKAAMKYSHGANSMNMGTTSNHNFTLRTNDAERIRIMNGGSVNIGGDYAQTTYKTQITGDLLIQKSQAAYQHPQLELYATSNTAHGGAIKFSAMYNSKYQLALIKAYGGSGSPNSSGGSLGFSTGDGTEKLNITAAGELLLNGINYIETADLRVYSNNNITSNGNAMKFTTRYTTNSSLISVSETGGTGSGTRITFNKRVYVNVSVSQDVDGNTDSSYWWMGLYRDGTLMGQHLTRKTSEWDNFVWSQTILVPANSWIEIRWGSNSGLTSLDGTNWSHYTFTCYQSL